MKGKREFKEMRSGRKMLTRLGSKAQITSSSVIIEEEVEAEEAAVDVAVEEDMDIKMIISTEDTEVAEEATEKEEVDTVEKEEADTVEKAVEDTKEKVEVATVVTIEEAIKVTAEVAIITTHTKVTTEEAEEEVDTTNKAGATEVVTTRIRALDRVTLRETTPATISCERHQTSNRWKMVFLVTIR
jgi:hypothetical protein